MSAPGKPLDVEAPGPQAPEAETAPARKVLVVDDVPYLLDLARLFLARTGRVTTALGGRAGLALARETRPDVIVCDDFMPDLDGLELCRAIREDPDLADTPFVMLLSDPSARAHGAAIRAGADDVIPKPLERMPLVEGVARFLARSQVRGLPRVDTDVPVTLTTPAGEGRGTVRNVSRGGAFVETDLPLGQADEVGLRFQLPDGTVTLHPHAKVVWKRARYQSLPARDGAGLRFVEIDAASARAIDDYVYERATARVISEGVS